MTSLKITPNFEKKTAKFEGTIAGGERVRVEISDANKYIGGLDSLRLRAVGSQGETLAQFPFENSQDTWVQENGKIICELNLNTDKLLEAVPPASRVMVLFVLDDGGNEVLYFKSFCAVDHWPRKVGEEEPVDLGGYADFVKDATESIASAEAAIEKASENAMNASKNAEEAAKNAKEAVATAKKIESSLSTKADKTELADEVTRATQSEVQIDGKINTIIADDAGKSARTIAAEEVAKVVADAPADFDTLKEIAEYIESDKTGAAQMVTKIDDNANAIAAEAQRAQEAEAALRNAVDGKVDAVEGKGLSTNDYTTEDMVKLAEAYTPANPPPPPDLSGYATKAEVELVNGSVASVWDSYQSVVDALTEVSNKADAALPRYYFTILEVVNGVVTVPPYTSADMPSDGTAFTVAVGEGNGDMRDCILIVVCGDVAPTITWPANFHPRTDAGTDFACVAGATNVYWISEYVQGEFVVAGWQATEGGSAA